MLPLGASMRTIFAVAGDVEHRPQFLLQLHGFQHQFFRAGVVVDGRQDRKRFFTGEKDVLRVAHAADFLE